ncbi:MAG: PAC2 family protein [Candidatus Bathyarchaeia archaeon]
MSKEEFSVIELARIEVKNPKVIVGIPDVGLVGLIAAGHLIQSLGMKEVGYFESEALPPIMIFHNGDPKAPIRIYSKDDLILIISEIPLPASLLYPLAKSIVKLAKKYEAKFLIDLSGLSIPDRLEVERPTVYGIGTNEEAKDLLKGKGIPFYNDGIMVGAYALIVKESLNQKVSNITLLAESHYQFPDPEASAYLLEALKKLIGIEIDVKPLLDQAEEIRIKARELMRRTQESMKSVQKDREKELPGIYA